MRPPGSAFVTTSDPKSAGHIRREAEEFLKTKLANGAAPVDEIRDEAEANGISINGALKRAKTALKIRTWKEKGRLDGAWHWELPPPEPAGRRYND
jgi:hypothetical protein